MLPDTCVSAVGSQVNLILSGLLVVIIFSGEMVWNTS
jgi:hypothetical protein